MENSLIVLDPLKLARKEFLVVLVKQGLRTFKEVGAALSEIQEEKLYLDECRSFDEFCRKNFDIGRSYGYQIIHSAEAAKNVSAITDIKTQSAARELAKATPDAQVEIVTTLVEQGKEVNQKNVHEAMNKKSKNQSKTTKSKPAPLSVVQKIEAWELAFRSEWTVMAYPSPTQVIAKLIKEVLSQ